MTGSRTAALLTTAPSMMAFAGRLARCAELGYCAHTGIHLDQLITFGHKEISAQPTRVRVDRAAVLDWTEHLRTHFEDWDLPPGIRLPQNLITPVCHHRRVSHG